MSFNTGLKNKFLDVFFDHKVDKFNTLLDDRLLKFVLNQIRLDVLFQNTFDTFFVIPPLYSRYEGALNSVTSFDHCSDKRFNDLLENCKLFLPKFSSLKIVNDGDTTLLVPLRIGFDCHTPETHSPAKDSVVTKKLKLLTAILLAIKKCPSRL